MCDWSALGEGESPAQNPPDLERDDAEAIAFFKRTATQYVRDFGLLPLFVGELGPDSPARRIFLAKQAALYSAQLEDEMRKTEKKDG